jgi:hypothetical protein
MKDGRGMMPQIAGVGLFRLPEASAAGPDRVF